MSRPAASPAPWPAARTGWYTVGVLTVAYIFSFIDRSILTLLVGPIRADLGISDTQISLLHGFAFAIFYTILGIPIAALADRRNRRNIIVVGVAFWSLATATCGLARNFWQLFAARVGVGVGEAALSPAAYSMIADSFPPQRLGRALGVYTLGAFAGVGLALIIGGAVISQVTTSGSITLPLAGTLRPWQAVFFIVGLPGLLVAGWLLTMREPVRRQPPADGDGFSLLLRYMRQHPAAFTAHLLAFSLLGIIFNAVTAWTPTHLIRTFGLTPGSAGLYFGLLILVFGTSGVFAGGWLADHLQQRGRRDGTLITGMLSAAGLLPFGLLAPVTADLYSMLLLYAPFVFFGTFAYGAAPAAIQFMTPGSMRAMASAIYLFFLNLVGMGLGPFVTALITDYVFRDDLAVGRSLALVTAVVAPLVIILLWWGLAPFRRAVAAAGQPNP